MTHYGQITMTLATAGIGFEMVNDKNGRQVEVTGGEHRYYCKDRKNGIFYWTDNESDAYKWLEGSLYPAPFQIGAAMNPYVKPLTGVKGGKIV